MIDKALYEKISRWGDEHFEEMAEELQFLARMPSVSREDLAAPDAPFGPDCRALLNAWLKRMRDLGFEAGDNGGYYGDAWLGSREEAVGLIGHGDVVPVGNGWTFPPFGATRTGDFLIGRGVSDNKSACAIGIMLLRMVKENGIPLKHGLRVILGMNEETGMEDMRYLTEHGPVPPVSLVPDGAFPVNFAQKGRIHGFLSQPIGEVILSFEGGQAENVVPDLAHATLRVDAKTARRALTDHITAESVPEGCRLTAHGVSAHAARPENGVNALGVMAKALKESGLLDAEGKAAMERVYALCADTAGRLLGIDCRDEVGGDTTMACGVARTDNGRLALSIDCRTAICQDNADAVAALRENAVKMGLACDTLGGHPAFYIPRDDARIRFLSELYTEVTGEDGTPYVMGGGTYSGCVKNAITFGLGFPGTHPHPDIPEGSGGAHQPDEYIYLPNLLRAFKLIAYAAIALDRGEIF